VDSGWTSRAQSRSRPFPGSRPEVNVSSRGLGRAIQILLERLMSLQAGENLLLYLDQGSDTSIADAIRLHAQGSALGLTASSWTMIWR
jgi:hypothetical protein